MAPAEETTPGSLPPLQAPRPLAEDAANLIREQILSGGFRPGERLVEARIAQQLNVSRGPVREAFKLLRAEGLVEEEPRRGTFVARLSSDDVRDIYDLRAAIEGRAARLVAASRSDRDLEDLRGAVAAIERAAARGDARAVSQADLAFHEALCRVSGNGRLYEVFTRYVPMIRALLRLDEQLLRGPEQSVAQHRPLIQALENKDPELAAKRFEEHVDEARELVVRYLESRAEG